MKTAASVKQAVDRLAVTLHAGDNKDAVEGIRGAERKLSTMNYVHRKKGFPRAWVVSPHFDLYDLARLLSASEALPQTARRQALKVMQAVDALVVASFAGKRYRGFEPGRNGVYIVFPDGDADWNGRRQWDFSSGITRMIANTCVTPTATTPGVAMARHPQTTVENWFELLDAWFDTPGGCL